MSDFIPCECDNKIIKYIQIIKSEYQINRVKFLPVYGK